MVRKENGGQLSSFHAALPLIRGDWVSFLDADDLFTTDRHAAVREAWETWPDAGMIYSACRSFGDEQIEYRSAERDTLIGQRRWLALGGCGRYLHEKTSSLNMTTALLRDILPYPETGEWRTRADDILVFGAQYSGALVIYLNRVLMCYRVHGENTFARRVLDQRESEAHNRLRDRHRAHFFRTYRPPTGVSVGEALAEFRANPDMMRWLFSRYVRWCLRHLPPQRRLEGVLQFSLVYLFCARSNSLRIRLKHLVNAARKCPRGPSALMRALGGLLRPHDIRGYRVDFLCALDISV